MHPIAPNTPWLSSAKLDPRTSLRLFCFPYAGGGAQIYRSWSEGLPSSVDVCPVHLPGRGGRLRDPAFSSSERLVEAAHEALAPYMDVPFAFFGHSMGAVIAFELARAIRGTGGAEPAHLYVSGRRAPHVEETRERTHDLPEAEFVEELARLNGTPKEVLEHPELMELMLPLLRADFAVCETYVFRPDDPLSCPITAFGGLEDGEAPREKMDGWRQHTTGPFALRMFVGDHFFINAGQKALLQALYQSLYLVIGGRGATPR